MIILKVIMWIVVIALILVVLIGLLAVLLLNTKTQFIFDYTSSGVNLKLKYGLIPIKLLPKSEKKKKKSAGKRNQATLASRLKYYAEPFVNKAKESVQESAEKMAIEREIKEAEDLSMEEDRILEEKARINAELEKVKEEAKAAQIAEDAGIPLPEVVDESKVSKLQQIKDSYESLDLETAYINVKSFVKAFDYDSIVALLSYIGSQSKTTFGKVGKRVVFKRFEVALSVHGKDAADTAIKYGMLGTVAFPAMSKFVKTANVKNYDLDITPDFLAKEDKGEFHLTVAVRPLRLVSPLVPYAVKVGTKSYKTVGSMGSNFSANKSEMQKEAKDKLNQQYVDAALSRIK